jgi:hypothetical protein
VLRSEHDDLADVRDVRRGRLPRPAELRFESSVRTWSYVASPRRAPAFAMLASAHTGSMTIRDRGGRGAVRSTTVEHLRTTNHERLAAIREQLDHDERTILILWVDRQLAWREIAQVIPMASSMPRPAARQTGVAQEVRGHQAPPALQQSEGAP